MPRDLNRPVREAWIVDAVRTPIGRYGGALASVRPDDLAAVVIRAIVDRTSIDPTLVEDVILGCANQAGEDNRNVARMASLLAGLPVEVAGQTVNRLCGSGLQAVNAAAHAIGAGDGDLFIAGGVESMTRAPYVMLKPEAGYDRGPRTMEDTTLGWRFVNPRMQAAYPPISLGETAECVADQWTVPRERQDAFALESQRRAAAAIAEGRFEGQLVPVEVTGKKGAVTIVDRDEHPRETSMEALAALKPAFRAGGSVTAGNSSGINDGAAALLLVEASRGAELGLRPLARVVSTAVAGVHPDVMGIGPVPAVRKALARAGIEVSDLDVVEINEAFASQSVACMDELGLDPARVNPNGGAIALGHPLGASGARLVTMLVHELERIGGRYGLATMCIGVGQGIATVVERVEG
ncbi:MAG TPA: acetyl-CoA C-acyltransferase [Candidatus Limnocylindrales bacterium]|jgi:3-oxoadipyl-CoA thiolase|nr:acetyl-CoA C-acyltransferase [Candidatus Limnocylindrales bacterium]